VELLDKDSERLSHLLRWRQLEGIFWKWMESVIDAKQASVVDVGGGGDSGGDNMLAVYSATQLTESHHSLQQAILKYESIVEHLERICEEKVCCDFYICKWSNIYKECALSQKEETNITSQISLTFQSK